MRFLADENFPADSVRLLREAGLDVVSVGEDYPSVKDSEVMQLAIETQRTVLTFDTDFGTLIFQKGIYPPQGVILLRLFDFQPEEPGRNILALLQTQLDLTWKLTVIDERSIRQKSFP